MKIDNVIQTVQDKLNEASSRLLPWFDENNEVLRYMPKDGGWSALQILEHVVLTSHYLLLLIDKGSVKALKRARTSPVSIDWNDYVLAAEPLENIGVHKSFTWVRPEHMEPTGTLSVKEIKAKFDSQMKDCANYLQHLKNGEGVLCKTTMTVNGIGKLDVYQYIYFLALHAIRHARQLEENKNEFQAQIKHK